MIYYHFTESFLNQTKYDTKVLDVLQSFFEEHLDKNSIKGIGKISAFTKSIYVFRNKTPYFEAVLEERTINHQDNKLTVYFVRGLKNLKNSLQEYVDIRDGKWIEKRPFNPIDESNFISNFEKNNRLVSNLEKIPEDLISWQNDYKLKITYDIYESDLWVNYAVNNSPKDGLRVQDSKLFLNILRKVIIQMKAGSLLASKNDTHYYSYTDEDFNIELLYISITILEKRYIIVFGGSHIVDQPEHALTINQKFESFFQSEFQTLQDISEFCLKAYPSWTLKEDELWLKIQKNSEFGNLSLLPEQTSFLEEFQFPKYINGQAGSGKSTILYYLFSNIYYYKCAGEIKGDIIFITENEQLLKHTIMSVYDLVLNNPEFQLSSEDADLISLKKNFFSFKSFLKGLLPEPDIFNDEKYLDFSKFKLLYENSAINNSIKRRFSPEIIWFTVTTYIYGLDLKEQVTSKNYEEKLPKEGKDIISKEDFILIEKEILKPFYDKLIDEEGYWNKITLIKYIINNNLVDKRYEVIFCDESQDFSKVELEFIISLSLYSGYNLSDVQQFPIVFAGDALQTVNPTGFRSEVLTSMIFKSLTDPLVGFKLNQKDLVFTPEYNYRSSPTIVTISNVIQNWRKFDLKEDIKDFQKPKRKDKYANQNLNTFVVIESFSTDVELQQKIEYKTIIVPVNTEEIDQFKDKHPVLKNFKNIISSVDAKGLDFSEVVIYGFGDLFTTSDFGVYEKKYFYNKLYVAVTRTRDELVIIDSNDAKINFWDRIINSFIETDWNKNTFHLQSADELLVSDSKNVIQSKNQIVEDDAKTQKEIGWANKNIPLIRIASNHFLKIGNYEEYYLCLGLIEEVKGDYLKASENYLHKELISNAEAKKRTLYSFWNGKYFERLRSLVSIEGTEKRLFDILCNVLTVKNRIFGETDINILEDNLKTLSEIKRNTNWTEDFKNLFLENITLNYQPELNYRLYEILDVVFKDVLTLQEKEKIADILFENGQYNYSLLIYENISVKNINYYLCHSEIAKKRRKHEDVVLNLGKIIYEGFSKNKLEHIAKTKIAEDLLFYYLEHELESSIISDDPYYYAYILISKLYHNDETYFDDLKEYDKVIYLFKISGRENELLPFFYYLLEENLFTNIIYNRAIKDWAKLYNELYSIEDLNEEYKALCLIKDIPYIPFTHASISSQHNQINKIRVQNFRQFEDLEINNIGLLNLIVGDNNIGKTSTLELFLIIPDQEEYYKRLLFSYIERSKIIPERGQNSEKTEYFYNIDSDFLKEFARYGTNENPTFEILSGRNIDRLNVIINDEQNSQETFTNLNFSKVRKPLGSFPFNDLLSVPFYSYGKGYGKDLAIFYDNFVRRNREIEELFLQNIELFIPKIENILLDADGGINIRLIDDATDRPLHSFGDGANKLFRILILLTIHKGKLLLIDEIDSGIHYSRFKQFWNILITIAVRDNTQLIVTTHNKECISYFAAALTDEIREHSRVIQLLRTNRLKSITYDFENFNLALEDNIELRG